jgi:hypothetical protein
LPRLRICGRIALIEIAAPAKWVLCTIGSFPRRTSVRDIHVAFQIPLCRQQAEVIQNHENENVSYIEQGEASHRKYKRLKLGGGHVYYCSSV